MYAAAVVIHPGRRWRYFELKWTAPHQIEWLDSAKAYVQAFWEDNYRYTNPQRHTSSSPSPPPRAPSPNYIEQDELDAYMNPPGFYDQPAETETRDEYAEYIRIGPEPCERPLKWWGTRRQEYPRLSQMAFDLLSMPLMSAECERIFSKAKRFVTDDRARLNADIIEAMIFLKAGYEAEKDKSHENGNMRGQERR